MRESRVIGVTWIVTTAEILPSYLVVASASFSLFGGRRVSNVAEGAVLRLHEPR